MSITVQLPKFEGPLGLLLYLIRKDEMDIMDIKIHDITKQYLDFIKLMKELDLEVAGEFVAMAATLIQIKSRMLLPQYDENGEVVENEDPRKELVQKLIEYQKYQEAAKMLYERPLVGRDLWLRGTRENLRRDEEDIVLEDNALFALISSYRQAMRTMKKKIHKVSSKLQSIASRILEIKDRLIVGRQVTMMELVDAIENRSRQALITFLSLLELGKMGLVSIYQTEVYADIYINAKKPIETDVVSRVEEYDNLQSEEIVANMMDQAKKDAELLALIEAEEEQKLVAVQQEQITKQIQFQLEQHDFVLNDGEVDDQIEKIIEEEIASDDEILAAEQELFANGEVLSGELEVNKT